jgi:hypothetical protein
LRLFCAGFGMRSLYCCVLGAAAVVTMEKLVIAMPPSPFQTS